MSSKGTFLAPLMAFAGRLRFPYLFLITLVAFLLNLIIPDAIPFADEILLGLMTALLASLKKRGQDKKPQGEEVKQRDADDS